MGISKNFLQTIQLAVQNLEGYWPGCLMSAIWEVVLGWGSTDIGPYRKVKHKIFPQSWSILFPQYPGKCLSQCSHNIQDSWVHGNGVVECWNWFLYILMRTRIASGLKHIYVFTQCWNVPVEAKFSYGKDSEHYLLKRFNNWTGQLKCAVCWTLVRFPNFIQ